MLKWMLVCSLIVNAAFADEPPKSHADGKLLRTFFPQTRQEQTGRAYSGAIAQPVIGATETIWGAKLTKWAWSCEASPSKWKAIKWAKGGTRLAAGLGGVAMMADNGVRAWVYFGLEADPTVSPLLTMTLGEDAGTLGGKDQKSIQALSAEEQDTLIKEQLAATGVDLAGMATCKFLPDFLKKTPPEMIASAKMEMQTLETARALSNSAYNQVSASASEAHQNVNLLKTAPARLDALREQHAKLKAEFETSKNAFNEARGKAKTADAAAKPALVAKATELRSISQKIAANVEEVAKEHEQLVAKYRSVAGSNPTGQLTEWERLLDARKAALLNAETKALAASATHAQAVKRYLSLTSPWVAHSKEGFRKLWVGFKWTAGKAFLMDLEGRIYRTDSLSVDPTISPLVQWTVEDAVPKSYQTVDGILKDTQQGWESLEDGIGNTFSGATERTKNRFSEILNKKE